MTAKVVNFKEKTKGTFVRKVERFCRNQMVYTSMFKPSCIDSHDACVTILKTLYEFNIIGVVKYNKSSKTISIINVEIAELDDIAFFISE